MPLRQGETVPQMIVRVAREQGLDARGTRIALAIAAQESRFNPQAEGDWSDAKNRMRSIGLFQLNEEGLGSGMGDTRYDPEANANRGIANLKAVLAKHGAESDGRVAYLSQRPADEAGYTNSINAKTAGRDAQWAGTIDSAMRGVGGAAPDAPEAQPQVQAGVPVFPLAGQSLANTQVTTEFGAHGSNAGYAGVPETHRGTDLSAKRGAQVLSPSGGTVTTAHNWDGTKNDPYGNWIEVKGDDGKSYRFAHLQSLNVQQGAKVGGGQTIGTVDSTGNSTGDHLHFEVLDQAHGNAPVNPKEYLSGSQTASGGRTVADTSEASYLVTALEKQKEEARIASEAAKREQGLREAEKRNNDAEIAQKSTIKKPDDATKKRIEELKTRNNDLALIIPAAETKAVEADKLFRAIDVQLATARQQASGKELDPSQRSENEAQAEQARANAAKLEEDVRSSKDPASRTTSRSWPRLPCCGSRPTTTTPSSRPTTRSRAGRPRPPTAAPSSRRPRPPSSRAPWRAPSGRTSPRPG
jgi:murein DD-endopeptidase MepM/ murein hydrolase activator NlpD